MNWRGSCEDCAHWNWDENSQSDEGKVIGPHCGIFSVGCATSIMNKGKSTRFLSWDDVPVRFGGLLKEDEPE